MAKFKCSQEQDFYDYCLDVGSDNRNYFYMSKFIIGPRYPHPDRGGRERDAFWAGYEGADGPPRTLGIIYAAYEAGKTFRKEIDGHR
jgi:hypothetical protein